MEVPVEYQSILQKSDELGFTMSSDPSLGNLLRTLVGSKPGGNFLELGTGTGLALSWILDGADSHSKVTAIDNEQHYLDVALSCFKDDHRLEIICTDSALWIKNYEGPGFDLIFADTWAGKFEMLEETLRLIKPGGFYIVDDLKPQSTWPEGHSSKVDQLLINLKNRSDFYSTHLEWSSGIVILTKRS